ncbi:unnamed protein product [Ranitomeya imitator]|uniref:Uncharacterized protein n=1 Tax=Ranitomeya imitator TaxID=111125 RepID=A0ABN9LZ49_9NEOB|nr:unnamed protein product [Ranitomeya imitator]
MDQAEKNGFDIRITEQPVCACVPLDFPLTLCCKAQGPTLLYYQWFMQSEEPFFLAGMVHPLLLRNQSLHM